MLTKLYKVVYVGSKLAMPVTPDGQPGMCWPAKDMIGVEFDTYEEAAAYIEEHGLTYTGPEQMELN